MTSRTTPPNTRGALAAAACAALVLAGCGGEDAEPALVSPSPEIDAVGPEPTPEPRPDDAEQDEATGMLDVSMGSCLVGVVEADAFTLTQAVPCEEPHNAEVYASLEVSDAGESLGQMRQLCLEQLPDEYQDAQIGTHFALLETAYSPEVLEEGLPDGELVWCVLAFDEAVQGAQLS